MTRNRSTWQQSTHVAARNHKADPYSVNQEHPQPAVNAYESGSPDTWAETPMSSLPADSEYKGGAVVRNEIGLPEFRADTWSHKDSMQWNGSGRYDNHRSAAARTASVATRIAGTISSSPVGQKTIASALMSLPAEHLASISKHLPASLSPESKLKKSIACTRLAALMLNTDNERNIERLARELYKVRDSELKSVLATHNLIAGEEEEEEEKEEEGKKQAQQQQQSQQEQQAQQQEQQAQQQQQSQECQSQEQQEQMAHGLTLPELEAVQSLLEEEAGIAPCSPMDASQAPDITFGEPAPSVPGLASTASTSLESLFDHDPELASLRQTASAPANTASSFSGSRVASVKKLGNVVSSAPAPSVPNDLASLWK